MTEHMKELFNLIDKMNFRKGQKSCPYNWELECAEYWWNGLIMEYEMKTSFDTQQNI